MMAIITSNEHECDGEVDDNDMLTILALLLIIVSISLY